MKKNILVLVAVLSIISQLFLGATSYAANTGKQTVSAKNWNSGSIQTKITIVKKMITTANPTQKKTLQVILASLTKQANVQKKNALKKVVTPKVNVASKIVSKPLGTPAKKVVLKPVKAASPALVSSINKSNTESNTIDSQNQNFEQKDEQKNREHEYEHEEDYGDDEYDDEYEDEEGND